jgi:hypothetical protein
MEVSWRRRCDARAKHKAARKAGDWRKAAARCRKWAVPGKLRCHLHGGRSTGPRTPEGKARTLAALREGRARRILLLAAQGKKINTGHNGGQRPKDGRPMKRHISLEQQFKAAVGSRQQQQKKLRATLAAQHQEIELRRQLVKILCRGADAALVRNPRDPAQRQELIDQGHAAAAALLEKWSQPK